MTIRGNLEPAGPRQLPPGRASAAPTRRGTPFGEKIAAPLSGKRDRRRIHSAGTTSSGEITDCGRGFWTYGQNRIAQLGDGLSEVTRPDGSAFLITKRWADVTCHLCRRH